jgi:signal transduction histidine kinase
VLLFKKLYTLILEIIMKKIVVTLLIMLINAAFFSLAAAQSEKVEISSAKDLLIKREVETAVSMLQAIYTKHLQGEMNLLQAKKLGADLLRELRYGSEGYFWADTTEGVNVVLYGKKDVEGKNRLENRDKKGTFFIKKFMAIAKAGGGYTEYWFPKRGEIMPQPKRSYVLLFKPFGWVVGSGYYRDTKAQKYKAATQLKHFVERGADLIAETGEKAFDAFRQKGSEWFYGDRYAFVWDMNGLRYVYPPDARREGEQVRGLKDVDDKPIGELIIAIASSKEGKGWMHYRWPKPGEHTPSWKSTYVMKVQSPSGKAFIIGSGAYDMPVQKSFVVDAVDAAVKLIEKEGLKAFVILKDKRSQFIYQDTYVFVIAENGSKLLNVAFPKLEGRNVLDYKDAEGTYYVQAFIEVGKTKGTGWVDYLWPKPGSVKKSHKSTYIRKAMLDGRMVVVGAGLYRD